MILLFEMYKPELEFNNEVKEMLSQYPFLSYSIKEDDGLVISFGKKIDATYVKKIFTSYRISFLSEKPVSIKVEAKKVIQKYDEYEGKKVIGNIEPVEFPSINLSGIEAKIDSGAATSCLSCSYLKVSEDKKNVTFVALDKKYKQYTDKRYTAKIHSVVKVQSSNGQHEERPLIKLKVKLRGEVVETYFTLTDRSTLEYPVLLGKDLLSGYLIDSSVI